MSDYIPTTAVVRAAYQNAINEEPLVAFRQFHCWLEQHDAEIIAQTEERIIKLLEIGGPIEQIICDYWGDPEFDKDDALVLIEKAIKGENK